MGISDDGFRPFSLHCYRVQELVHGCMGRFLLDLNVLRRVLALHPRSSAKIGPDERAAAALLAFALEARVVLDPGLCLREWFPPGEDDKLKEQADLFLHLWHAEPEVFARIALGQSDRVSEGQLVVPAPTTTVPALPARPEYWDRDYVALLKVAVLALTSAQRGGSPADAMEEYLRWCWRDFMFSAPAILFGGLFLSPRHKKNMLKNLRSPDVGEAIVGVQNAAWDLAYMREWGWRVLGQQGTDCFHFFCSFDKALRESARDFVVIGDVPPSTREQLWVRLWGARDGKRLLGVYRELVPMQDDPRRAWKTGRAKERGDEIRAELEQELARLLGARHATGSKP